MARAPMGPPGQFARKFADAVREHMKQRGVTGLELAKQVGLSQNYMAKRLRYEASFTLNDIENIAAALHIPATDLVPSKGFTETKTRSVGDENLQDANTQPDAAIDQNPGEDPAAPVSMAEPNSPPDPDAAPDEKTQPMPARIDELFEKLPFVLSVNDLTVLLSKDRATVYRWLKKGEIPGVLIDTTWIIYREEVKDYLLSKHN